MDRIEVLGSEKAPSMEEEDEMADFWEDQPDNSPRVDDYKKGLAAIWLKTSCAAEGAPYVIRKLLADLTGPTSPFGARSQLSSKLAAAFLKEEDCPGAHGLSDDERGKLKDFYGSHSLDAVQSRARKE